MFKKKWLFLKTLFNFLKRKLVVLWNGISQVLLRVYNLIIDENISGTSLYGTKGGSKEIHSNEAMEYVVLKKIFNGVEILEKDSFLDVGCGNGRVIAYLLNSGFKGMISGVEIDAESFFCCKNWTSRYKNILLYHQSILSLSLNEYSILFLFNPFGLTTLRKMIGKIEGEVTHDLLLIYASDNEYGFFLEERFRWNLISREYYKKIGIFLVYDCPQRISVWRYCGTKI